MKNYCILQKINLKSIVVLHFCKSLLQNVWLNIRQYWIIYVFLLSICDNYHTSRSPWKTPLYACERMRMKKIKKILVLELK